MTTTATQPAFEVRVDDVLERSILGGALLLDVALAYADSIRAEDFGLPQHGQIWSAIVEVAAQGAVTPAAVAAVLRNRGRLNACGGMIYLKEATAYAPAGVEEYAAAVRDFAGCALVRRTALAVDRIGSLARSEKLDPEQFAKAALEAIGAATQRTDGRAALSHDRAVASAWEGMEKRAERKRPGLPLGIRELTERLNGLRPSQAVLVAGRPGMAKTSFALLVARVVAELNVGRVLFWSLEMPRDELVERMLSSRASVPLSTLIRGSFDDNEYSRVIEESQAQSKLGNRISWFDGDETIESIAAGSLREHQRDPLALVVIDHLHRVCWSKGVREELEHVARCAKGVKDLARKLGVPVLALAQLSRKPEGREDKRPQLHDLQGNGALEQNADVVIGLYRDEYYNPDSASKGEAELIVLKQRNGWTGTVRAAFDKEFTRFRDLDDDAPAWAGGEQ